MSTRFKIALLVFGVATIALSGCGSSLTPAGAPPGGAFSNRNLNGTYIVSFSGTDIGNSNPTFFAVLGTLTANGSGSITGGTIDIDDPALGAALQTGNVFTRLPATGS